MAEKILRLYPGGVDTGSDWSNTQVIDANKIQNISDPEGETNKKEITSIPSPFARMDLTLTAFEKVVATGKLDGNTIYHKMVSDSFDIGEIFFNIKKYSDKFQILFWDKNIHLGELINSSDEEHRAVGRTLEMYMDQDSKHYNFDKLQRIYMLNYIGPGKPARMNIVGATSPCTLFFSSANDLSYISEHIAFGNDKPFDGIFCTLKDRDFEYIKYLWAFRKNYRGFSRDFKAVNDYLDMTYDKLSYEQQQHLDGISQDDLDNYEPVDLGSLSNSVEILGHILHQRGAKAVVGSGFEIQSHIYDGVKPLVLPIDAGNAYASLKYDNDKWSTTNKAPLYDINPLEERTLPFVDTRHPYLTISDFLTDTIVRTPLEFNSDNYFDGNIKNSQVSYLMPLTPLFFDFFTVDQLLGEVEGGKKMIEMRENAGGVTVTLRIPIKGDRYINFIEYQRSYINDYMVTPEVNKGTIFDKEFGLGVYPFAKFVDVDAHYRIPLFDKGDKDIKLNFYNIKEHLTLKDSDRVSRREKAPGLCSIETYVLEKNFDRIELSLGTDLKGYVIPKLRKNQGTSEFVFAVDFGTSNTHIEYAVDGGPSRPFETIAGQQMVRLHRNYQDNADINAGFLDNNVPEVIGEAELFKFPMRTAFSECSNINYDTAFHTLASGNIAYRYEKASVPKYNKINTNLKWAPNKPEMIEMFLSNIYLMIRNKVIMEGGDLSLTKVVWFYPSSMTEAHYNKFHKLWHSLHTSYIGENATKQLISLSESVAPYSYFKSKHAAKRNVATIDIGGGTTDVYIVEDGESKMLSSFRFAANSIFGDGYGLDADNNGFVKTFGTEFEQILVANDMKDLQNALQYVMLRKNSSDIIAFFFALSDNQKVKEKDIRSLDFLTKLENNSQLRYAFILFYSAIIYYVAISMKAKGLAMPLTLAFSGNGSKTLRILSAHEATLSNYFKLIFEGVYGETYSENSRLQIVFDINPKLATCKGGILAQKDTTEFEQIERLKCTLLGVDRKTFSNDVDNVYKNKDVSRKVVSEVEGFVDFIFKINTENNNLFANKFDADQSLINKVYKASKEDLDEYLFRGMEQFGEESKQWGGANDENVNDFMKGQTLFFLPIVGMLNNIANKIANQTL